LFNRIALGVFAVCVTAAVRPEAAIGGLSDVTITTPRAATRAIFPAMSPSVGVLNGVQPKKITSAIDAAKARNAGLSPDVVELAMKATACAASSGAIDGLPPTLTVIDYSLPSVEPRLWVFDMATGDLLFKELVAHGRNTGENLATRFSNEMDSRQTSLGLFVTDDPYIGSNGYSLRLDGLDVGFNDRARDRAIVMHGAPYVDPQLAAAQGRIGRSWGCPALRTAIAAKVIDTIRDGGVVFSYYPDQEWLRSSRFLRCGTA
jgi:hypothetical protein